MTHARRSAWLFCIPILALLLSAAIVRGDEVADIKAILEKHGLKPIQSTLVLAGDPEFVKQLEALAAPKKQLFLAVKELKVLEMQGAQGKAQMSALRQEQIRINGLLAGDNDVTTHNKLVGAINALDGQMTQMEEQLEQHNEKVRKARGAINESREKIVETVLKLRTTADKLVADYSARNANKEVTESMEKMKGITSKTYSLGPTTAFSTALKKLKTYEDAVLSETIELREENSTFQVSVVIDGKHTQEMCVDSGSTYVALPHKMAEKFGFTPTSKDEKIRLVLADGREIDAWKMKAGSMRVGKFTVQNVDIAVLGPEAVAAEPILGMSFLQNFQFEVDSANRTLTMVKLADEK